MSKCQRHSVQLLTARTVNDRRRRQLSSLLVSRHLCCCFFDQVLSCFAPDKRIRAKVKEEEVEEEEE
ncbi:hypothetical protein ANTQUA_LOCUS6164 [Anthophora quadrimaculata]